MGVTEERGRKEKRKRDLASFEKKTHRKGYAENQLCPYGTKTKVDKSRISKRLVKTRRVFNVYKRIFHGFV